MKICFVGSHSTGKTTLLNALKNESQFKDYEFVTEIVRSLNLAKNKETNEVSQLVYFNYCFHKLITGTDFITDRSILDAWAYTYYIRERVNVNIMKYINYSVNNFMEKYDIIFYTPIEFKLVEDNVRDSDELYRQSIDRLIINKLRQLHHNQNLNIYTATGTVEERMKFILDTINSNYMI